LSREEKVKIIHEETLLHPYRETSKYASSHKNADEIAYYAAMVKMNLSTNMLLY